MEISSLVFVAVQLLLSVNSFEEHLNFYISPNPAYVGEQVTFTCCVKPIAHITVKDFGNNSAECTEVSSPTAAGNFYRAGGSVNCSADQGALVLRAFAYATIDMQKRNYACKAAERTGSNKANITNNITMYVSEMPELLITPRNNTFIANQNVTFGCSTNSSELQANVTLTLIIRNIKNKVNHITMSSSSSSVETTVTVTLDFHQAAVVCEAHRKTQLTTKQYTLHVNYRSIVNYDSNNNALSCAEHVGNHPGVLYEWFLNNSRLENETKSSYTCETLYRCNTNITCVATHNVTHLRSMVTFVYQSQPTNRSSEEASSTDSKADNPMDNDVAVSVVSVIATVVAVSILIVLVWRRRICRKKLSPSSETHSHGEMGEGIAMTDNDLYEAMPMLHISPTGRSVCTEESLVIASATISGNLKKKVGNKAYLVLFSDQYSTLGDIQKKIDETVSARHSVKKMAILLRHAKNGLLLSLPDSVSIHYGSVASHERLRDFLKQLVDCYMDKSSDERRLDLLNCPDAGTSKGLKMAKKLADLLGIPVFLSSDMFGVTTAIDPERCVADLYFHRRHIDNPVIYAEVDLPKDSRQIPAESQDKVVYSEIVRPALRAPTPARP